MIRAHTTRKSLERTPHTTRKTSAPCIWVRCTVKASGYQDQNQGGWRAQYGMVWYGMDGFFFIAGAVGIDDDSEGSR